MDADKLLVDWADVTGHARRPAQAPTDSGARLASPALRVAGGVVMVAAIVAAVAWIAPRQGGGPQVGGVVGVSPSPVASQATFDCPVTRPNGDGPDGEPADPLYHGVGGLSTVLWPDGTVLVQPSQMNADGSLGMKFVFFRDPPARGELAVTGRRLDGTSPPMAAEIPDGYGDTGVQATGLRFPVAGCWEISATSGPATLTFVTRVVAVEEIAPPAGTSPGTSPGA